MIKIAYVTKVSLSVSAAQSIQIRKMGEAFYKELGEKFLLVSAGDDAGLSGGYHKRFTWGWQCTDSKLGKIHNGLFKVSLQSET